MRRIGIEDRGVVQLVTEELRGGSVVVLPTDTLYGFSTCLSSRSGHERIARLKQSPHDRKFLYLASSVDMVKKHVRGWGCTSERTLRDIWPAPLTAILPSARHNPEWIGDTIAFRVPRSEMLLRIVDEVGEPILSTSINQAGEPPLDDPDAIAKRFGDAIELIVIGSAGVVATPSTLVDFVGESPRLLRPGSYAWPTGANPSK